MKRKKNGCLLLTGLYIKYDRNQRCHMAVCCRQVNFHLIQCVHQHMHLTAGKAGGSSGVAGASAPMYGAGRGVGAPASGIKQQQQQQSGAGQGGNAPQGTQKPVVTCCKGFWLDAFFVLDQDEKCLRRGLCTLFFAQGLEE